MDNTEEIDKLIKDTLTQEETKFYDSLDEQGVFGMVRGLFKGKLKWMIVMMIAVNFVIMGVFIYCLIQFFNTEETMELIKWAAAAFICLLMVSMLKLFSWMQMNKNALMREIKRLELLVSSLSHK
tara:strand:- start:19364 stop:19738 length:375 start_codon:yes stop_codon:yes gene_type:complete